MLTPNGLCANRIEKVMLLALWANALNDGEIELQTPFKKNQLIFAGIGKPTYPINPRTIESYLSYWKKIDTLTKEWRLNPEKSFGDIAVDYGDPRGDAEPLKLMAESMSVWYKSEIKAENILFTVGGIGALRVLFETFNTHYEDIPGYRIITPFPHYSAYSNNLMHRLHPIDVMKESGYKLTAKSMEDAIKEAYFFAESDHGWPKAVLMCNPSNPLGTVIDEVELRKIADVLRDYPELHIIFDEAYTEMSYIEMPSFLKLAPDLKNRVIIMRSATKALSAAGERMAILLVFDKFLMSELLNKNISYFIHAPRSAQMAYAQTMAQFDATEQTNLAAYYKKKVDYVIQRLGAMGASMPDLKYQVDATFYALGDFSDLFGLNLPLDAQQALQKTGEIISGEDLAYYLLFTDAVMITPLSYFGLPKECGFMRITCSGNEGELHELMDRLEYRLLSARKNRKRILLEQINAILPELKKKDDLLHEEMVKKITRFSTEEDSCFTLKITNHALTKLQSILIDLLEVNNYPLS